MNNDEPCQHEELIFASGDYYLYCHTCTQYWVMKAVDSDAADASLSHQQPGDSSLTGQSRVKRVPSN